MKKFNYFFVIALTLVAAMAMILSGTKRSVKAVSSDKTSQTGTEGEIQSSEQNSGSNSDANTNTNINTDSDIVSVMLVPAKGMKITSANPVQVDLSKGNTADFKVTFEDPYFYRETEGVEYIEGDGILRFSGISAGSGNLYYTPAKNCMLSLTQPENGSLSITDGRDKIAQGENASITVTPNDHYELAEIMVNGEQMPLPAGDTFSFEVKEDSVVSAVFKGETVTFMTMSTHPDNISILNSDTDFHYLDVVELTCTYDQTDMQFLGWSKDAYIADGGSLISEAASLSYTLVENTVLFANFRDISTGNIHFDANGGSLVTAIDMYEQSAGTDVYLPVDTGALVRGGCSLIGYSTTADGSGQFYALGGMMRVQKGDVTLYAQWLGESSASLFNYVSNGEIVQIQGFRDAASKTSVSCLVIPKAINGALVNSIAPDAFRGCTGLGVVLIPNGVKIIETGAFAECPNLTFLYMPETLEGIGDGAFAGSPITRMRVLACYDKVFDYDYDSSLADKYSKLVNTPGKRIILIGGSSATFGLNSPMVEAAFPGYSVINFSCSFLDGITPLFDMLEDHVHEGDIMIFAPEYFGYMYATTQCESSSHWQYLESNFNILEDINLQKNSGILVGYMKYLYRKHDLYPHKLANPDSVYVRGGMNSNGDLIIPRACQGIFQPEFPSTGLITQTSMAIFNENFRVLTERGARCLFSFPPMSNGDIYTQEQVNERTANFYNALCSSLDPNYCTVISTLGAYSFPAGYFYDSMYHMTLDGAVLRTNQLITDLRNWGGIQ